MKTCGEIKVNSERIAWIKKWRKRVNMLEKRGDEECGTICGERNVIKMSSRQSPMNCASASDRGCKRQSRGIRWWVANDRTQWEMWRVMWIESSGFSFGSRWNGRNECKVTVNGWKRRHKSLLWVCVCETDMAAELRIRQVWRWNLLMSSFHVEMSIMLCWWERRTSISHDTFDCKQSIRPCTSWLSIKVTLKVRFVDEYACTDAAGVGSGTGRNANHSQRWSTVDSWKMPPNVNIENKSSFDLTMKAILTAYIYDRTNESNWVERKQSPWKKAVRRFCRVKPVYFVSESILIDSRTINARRKSDMWIESEGWKLLCQTVFVFCFPPNMLIVGWVECIDWGPKSMQRLTITTHGRCEVARCRPSKWYDCLTRLWKRSRATGSIGAKNQRQTFVSTSWVTFSFSHRNSVFIRTRMILALSIRHYFSFAFSFSFSFFLSFFFFEEAVKLMLRQWGRTKTK